MVGRTRTLARMPALLFSLFALLLSLLSAARGQSSNDEALILVMGPSGTGKTTYINTASGSKFDTSCQMTSCTDDVQFSPPFLLDGRKVTLVDTPGFDDTTKSEAEVLKMITHYLTHSYEQGKKPTGVIYMHRISDSRVGKVAKRNFNVFRKLCGNGALKNVVILTNMWGSVSEDVGEAYERKLASMADFFGPAVGLGARMLRHDNTVASAHEVIRSFFGNSPAALQIQREMVDKKKGILHTAAWQTLYHELARDNDLEMANLRKKDRNARTPDDEKRRRRLGADNERLKADVARNAEDFEKEKAQYRKDFQERLDWLEQRRKDEAAAAAERERVLREQVEEAESDPFFQIAMAVLMAATGGAIVVPF